MRHFRLFEAVGLLAIASATALELSSLRAAERSRSAYAQLLQSSAIRQELAQQYHGIVYLLSRQEYESDTRARNRPDLYPSGFGPYKASYSDLIVELHALHVRRNLELVEALTKFCVDNGVGAEGVESLRTKVAEQQREAERLARRLKIGAALPAKDPASLDLYEQVAMIKNASQFLELDKLHVLTSAVAAQAEARISNRSSWHFAVFVLGSLCLVFGKIGNWRNETMRREAPR